MRFLSVFQKSLAAAPVVAIGLALAAPAGAVPIEVNQIAPFTPTPTPGVWFNNGTQNGGTVSIVPLTGGGTLQNNAPLPNGAALLTTGPSNDDRAQITVVDSYGKVRDIFATLNVGYSYFKDPNLTAPDANRNDEAAPAIKLSFRNASTGGSATLIYEPYWNQPGRAGLSTNLVDTGVAGDWADVSISDDEGVFWTSGGFGVANSFGGPPMGTLNEWVTGGPGSPVGGPNPVPGFADPEFLDSDLVAISIGVGTFNQGQIGYVDDVRISHAFGNGFNKQYDFEAATVPEPGTLALFGLGLAGLGFVRRRRLN